MINTLRIIGLLVFGGFIAIGSVFTHGALITLCVLIDQVLPDIKTGISIGIPPDLMLYCWLLFCGFVPVVVIRKMPRPRDPWSVAACIGFSIGTLLVVLLFIFIQVTGFPVGRED